jgi:glycosyltransferase involved in cell wall biosynthesis
MRVVHFTLGSVDPDSLNGINRVIEGLATTMNSTGMAEVSVVTVRSKMRRENRQVFQRDGFTVTACRSPGEALKLFAERREMIDLVHLHNAWSIANIRVGIWLAQHNIPYVLTPHAAFLPDRMTSKIWVKSLFHAALQRNLLDRASALIAVSRDEMSSIAQFTANPKILYAPNGAKDVDWQTYRTQPAPSEEISKVKVGYLGRIMREKNTLALVQAISLLPKDIRAQLQLRIFGDHNNDYGRECEQLSKSLNLSETIHFCGKVSASEKWTSLGDLDAYIQPSLSEAASIAVLEAIAIGLPLVATRTSGVSYWQGQPFLTMVEPVASELSSGLCSLVRGRAQLAERGRQARKFFEDNFAWQIVVLRQFEIYRQCCAPGYHPSDA